MQIISGTGTPAVSAHRLANPAGNIALLDIVSALSFALDLTESAVPGHAARTCVVGMRIAVALGLSAEEQSSLYYALLLKDVGCSSYASRWGEIIGGDERHAGAEVSPLDWTRLSWAAMKSMWRHATPGRNVLKRLHRMTAMNTQRERDLAELIGLRSKRGAKIAEKIGLTAETAAAIRHIDEHWNGRGYPGQLRGEDIPLGSRIASLAQDLDIFNTEGGPKAAMTMMRRRSGRWFDPRLVAAVEVLEASGKLWIEGDAADRDMVLALDPGGVGKSTANQIDSVCEAFAEVVDAKSSFTYEHSLGVTRAAIMIASELGLDSDRQQLVYRSALLHDIGKLRVPNSILDKPGKLDQEEWRIIREHPLLTQRILERVEKFNVIAKVASQHHERLDGTGYPHGLKAPDLSIESRVIAVADVYGALSENRPYRPALATEEIMEIMGRDVPDKLDAACFAALRCALENGMPSDRVGSGNGLVPHALAGGNGVMRSSNSRIGTA